MSKRSIIINQPGDQVWMKTRWTLQFTTVRSRCNLFRAAETYERVRPHITILPDKMNAERSLSDFKITRLVCGCVCVSEHLCADLRCIIFIGSKIHSEYLLFNNKKVLHMLHLGYSLFAPMAYIWRLGPWCKYCSEEGPLRRICLHQWLNPSKDLILNQQLAHCGTVESELSWEK